MSKHWAQLLESIRDTMRRGHSQMSITSQGPQYLQTPSKMRERVPEHDQDVPIPVFNKRLFVAHGAVVLTPEARKLMARNENILPGEDIPLFSKSELQTMKCVVDGLRLVHRGRDYVKDALSHAVTFESYPPYHYIVKRPFEEQLSCYYILEGAVQVTYDMGMAGTRNVFQPDIIYNHGTGEFFGLVSPDGLSDDLSPPATVYTIEPSEFLRIDRQKFHAMVEKLGKLQLQEKLAFLGKPDSPLAALPSEALEKVFPHVHKTDYPPNKTILQQDDKSDYLYFILSGRCQLSREVFIPEIDRDVCFYLDSREQGDFFAEECLLAEEKVSTCHVTTTCQTTCFLMHKAALEVITKDLLLHTLESRRHYYPPDEELRDRGYERSMWEGYKHHEVRRSLLERGCLNILSRDSPEKVRSRPPSAEFQHKENLLRFLMKGAHYEPLFNRACSAVQRPSSTAHVRRFPLRPRTAVGTLRTEQTPSSSGIGTAETESSQDNCVAITQERSSLNDKDPDWKNDTKDNVTTFNSPVTSSFARMVEKKLPKGVFQKILGIKGCEMEPHLLSRALEENSELGRQLRLVWEMQRQQVQEGFTKTTVLVSMKTDDIVRKAKAVAEKQSFIATGNAGDERDEEGEHSSLEQENNMARTKIAGNKLRAAFLRKKIHSLQCKRAQAYADLVYRSARPGHVPVAAQRSLRGENRQQKPSKISLWDDLISKFPAVAPDISKQVDVTSCESSSQESRRSSLTETKAANSASGRDVSSAPLLSNRQSKNIPLRRRSADDMTQMRQSLTSVGNKLPMSVRAVTVPLCLAKSEVDVIFTAPDDLSCRIATEDSVASADSTSSTKHLSST